MTMIPFEDNERKAALYLFGEPSNPLLLVNVGVSEEEDNALIRILNGSSSKIPNLLLVSSLDWESELTPYPAASPFSKRTTYSGKGKEYLDSLLCSTIPKTLQLLKAKPSKLGIAGYSLSGLFTLFALTESSAFDFGASVSGSLWYPDFIPYLQSHPIQKASKVYLSLGEQEAKTKNMVLATVEANTEKAVSIFGEQGVSVTYELNPGNHFQDAPKRLAKAILSFGP